MFSEVVAFAFVGCRVIISAMVSDYLWVPRENSLGSQTESALCAIIAQIIIGFFLLLDTCAGGDSSWSGPFGRTTSGGSMPRMVCSVVWYTAYHHQTRPSRAHMGELIDRGDWATRNKGHVAVCDWIRMGLRQRIRPADVDR